MWMLISMVIGAVLVVLGLVRSYYRLLAVLLAAAIVGAVALAMLGGPVS